MVRISGECYNKAGKLKPNYSAHNLDSYYVSPIRKIVALAEDSRDLRAKCGVYHRASSDAYCLDVLFKTGNSLSRVDMQRDLAVLHNPNHPHIYCIYYYIYYPARNNNAASSPSSNEIRTGRLSILIMVE